MSVESMLRADAEGYVYLLRTCNADGSSYNGFQWPELGTVSCPDWLPRAECGNGLHGLPWAEGSVSYLNTHDADARWLVFRAKQEDVVLIDGDKAKARCGEVMFCGDKAGALACIVAAGADVASMVYGTATAGYAGTATAGDAGTATAGDAGTATAGYAGTATAGYAGTATAGDAGTATAGDAGTATAGDAGTATAGENGVIVVKWWDEPADRYRLSVGYVGEDGIEPGVSYSVDDAGKFVRVDAPEAVS